jgi:hypothetical protein
VSAKITIRELDGTEYQVKKRIAEMILAAGFSRRVDRGLHEMISKPIVLALKSVTHYYDSGILNPAGMPDCALSTYPVRDLTSDPKPFGSKQNWEAFPVFV